MPEAFGEGANEVDRAALDAARRLGIEVVEVSLQDLPYGALMNILYAEAAAAFGQSRPLAPFRCSSWWCRCPPEW